jgi:hypothetical protein
MKTIKQIINIIFGKKRTISSSGGFYGTDIWTETANKYDIKNKLSNFIKACMLENPNYTTSGLIIYGEVYGQGIQGEKYNYGLKSKEIVFFDIEDNGNYLSQNNKEFIFNILNIPTVDKLYQGKWSRTHQERFLYDNINNTDVPHEGLVISCISGDRQKVSKVINPNYHIFAEKFVVPDSH